MVVIKDGFNQIMHFSKSILVVKLSDDKWTLSYSGFIDNVGHLRGVF